MTGLAKIAIYILIGITGRKVFGYKGVIETVLWPITIPCVLYLKRKEGQENEY